MSRERLAILGAVRTAFLPRGTDYASLSSEELARVAVRALLDRSGFDPGDVDEVLFAGGTDGGAPPVPARSIALRAGLAPHLPALSFQGASDVSAQALLFALHRLRAGAGSAFIVCGAEHAGAVESIKPLSPWRQRDAVRAERLALEAKCSRADLDAFVLESHRRACAARGADAGSLAPVFIPPQYECFVDRDQGPLETLDLAGLAAAPAGADPVIGLTTAANSSRRAEGAVALLAMSERVAEKRGLKPIGYLAAGCSAACAPELGPLAPLLAIARSEAELQRPLAHADLVELHEASAAHVLACMRLAGAEGFARKALSRATPLGELPLDRLNVAGGSLAYGSAPGADALRMALTGLRELACRGARKLLLVAGAESGQASALWLEGPEA